MGGFSTVDGAIDNTGLHGKLQRLCFSKLMPSASVALSPHSLWRSAGIPAIGGDPSTGVANGRACSKTTAGAFTWLNDAASGEQTHLIGGGATSATASTTGTLIVCDRLSDIVLVVSQATSALTGFDGTARMAATTAPGDGGQLWSDVASGAGATTETFNFTYTNELGSAGSTTQNIVSIASAASQRPIAGTGQSTLWLPIAQGDTSIRSVSNITNVATNSTLGNVNYSIVRPLGYLPLVAVSQFQERDFIVEIPNIPKIFDGACIFFIYVPGAAVTATIFGELRAAAK